MRERETRDERRETRDERRETRDERRETRDERRETRDERRETRDERRETRDERRETRGSADTLASHERAHGSSCTESTRCGSCFCVSRLSSPVSRLHRNSASISTVER